MCNVGRAVAPSGRIGLTPLTLTARRSSPRMAKDVDYLTCVVPPSGTQRRSFQRPSSSRPRTASLHYPILLVLAVGLHAQTAPAGRALFEAQCANCHGGDGLGGRLGPAIVDRIQARGDEPIT